MEALSAYPRKYPQKGETSGNERNHIPFPVDVPVGEGDHTIFYFLAEFT